jgi:alkanesulfonate monooxygenase SsuD/methylene tetrahydromethanopterin reductase-like flavin-dependent oxidoreductase (luciferase family)
MKFSVWPSFQRPWSETLALARHAEATDWHGFWYADHYMVDTPDGAPNSDPAFECWSMLAAIGAAVPRLRLGSLVSPSTVHHPAVLAHQVTTIDHVSGGRVVLGIGAGWQVNEHRAYGIELFDAKARVDRFEEFLQVIHGLLRTERTTFAGRHFTVIDAPCEPKPVQERLPIMIGSKGPRMMGLAARWCDAWNAWGTPETCAVNVAALTRACERIGRDPASIERSTQALFFLNDDAAAVAKIMERSPADRTVAGGAERLVDAVGRYRDLGFSEVIVPDFTLGRSAQERLDTYDRFQAEVASAFA